MWTGFWPSPRSLDRVRALLASSANTCSGRDLSPPSPDGQRWIAPTWQPPCRPLGDDLEPATVMSMGWVKCGRILDAPWRSRPFVSHAAVPIAECVGGNLHRVYYSPRDEQNRSYVSRSLVDFGPTKPTVLQTDVEPLLSP